MCFMKLSLQYKFFRNEKEGVIRLLKYKDLLLLKKNGNSILK
jgi:hypothetical protein